MKNWTQAKLTPLPLIRQEVIEKINIENNKIKFEKEYVNRFNNSWQAKNNNKIEENNKVKYRLESTLKVQFTNSDPVPILKNPTTADATASKGTRLSIFVFFK